MAPPPTTTSTTILLTTWQGCSDPNTDPYTIKAAVRKTEQRQVVVYKKKRLMTNENLQNNKLFCFLRYSNQI